MSEYIERGALLSDIADLKKSPWYNDDYGFGTMQARHDGVTCVEELCVKQAPAADVVEVKHGNWSIRCKTYHDTHTGEYDEEFYLECSSCGREVWDINPADVCNYGKLVAQFPYCHCGAKMDGE